jgi:alpha-tubulin suppressor-like RCC1 family protein
MKRVITGLVLVAAFAACTDSPAPTQPDLPPVAEAISDAAHDGNSHFYFLTPMVPAPNAEGVFDGTVEPTVEICIWNGTECSAGLDYYTRQSGPGSETIRVDQDAEQYVVNWHTEDILVNAPLDEAGGESYRIRVLVGPMLLGYADVEVVAGGNELKNVSTGEYIPLVDGRTLPIKFRIEEGFDANVLQSTAAGVWHACAIDAQNDAWCWGTNSYGQLGTGSYSGSTAPAMVAGGHKWASLSAAGTHTCGVTLDGDAYCWGRNFYGQLGANIALGGRSPTPVPVQGDYTFAVIEVSVAGYTTCGVTTGGEALCWGYGRFGQVGNGTTAIDNPVPSPVSTDATFASIHVGATHVCARTTSNEGYCWGSNVWGQAGGGLYRSLVPVQMPGFSFQDIEAGYRHSCGVTTAGEAYCWGYNNYGSAGIGSRVSSVTEPTAVVGGLTFDRIRAGGYLTCALEPDGAAWCWGYNYYGSVGNGTTSGLSDAVTSPQKVVGGHLFAELDAGYQFACGATMEGDAVCWGLNDRDQIGSEYGLAVPSPVQVLETLPPTP